MPRVPRLAVMAGAILVLAVALFLLPGLLNIGGAGSAPPGGSASAPAASRTASRAPTVAPAPTPTVYTIKKNETLSKIAARYGLTLQELLAANPDIKNPNKVGEGQQIIIPTASGAPNAGGGSAAPAAS
jgi:Tfp pilus assembly protein FimV